MGRRQPGEAGCQQLEKNLKSPGEFASREGSDHSCTFRDVTFAGGVKHRFEKGEVRGRKQDRNPGIVLAINESLDNP